MPDVMKTESQRKSQTKWTTSWTSGKNITEIRWEHHRHQAPDLWRILSTPHSTLHVFEWGNTECGVWILSVEFWVSIIGPGSKLMTIYQYSTLKTPASDPCIWMGNLKVWKDSHSTLRNPQSNTWSVQCGVLSIRHKFGARWDNAFRENASLLGA